MHAAVCVFCPQLNLNPQKMLVSKPKIFQIVLLDENLIIQTH